MKTSVEVQRRAARAMKRAAHQGVDPRNTVPRQARIYKRIWQEDMRRKGETHVHSFGDDQRCECGAFFF